MRLLAFALLAFAPTFAPALARAESVHPLTRDGLTVEIVAHSDRLRETYGPRFDRTAFVTSARLDGHEYLHPTGLCDEFGLLGLGVIGYNEAPVGGTFVKIGVGRLVRDHDQPYAFSRRYPVERLFPTTVEATSEAVTVIQTEPGLYAYRKTYRLEPGRLLEIAYALTNLGPAPLPFETYNHNWLAFAGVASTSDYTITPAFDLPGDPPPTHRREGRSLQLGTFPAGRGANWAVDVDVPAERHRVVVRAPDGRTLTIGGDFALQRFAFWGNQHAFSPELFLRDALAPGQTRTWTRTYRFAAPATP